MISKASPIIAIAALVLAACNNASDPAARNQPTGNLKVPVSSGTQPQQTQAQVQPNTTTLPGATTQPVVTPVTNTVSKAGLNPEHGQPGHRCDIAVGAPLDSKPTTATTTAPANNSPVTISQQKPVEIQKSFSSPVGTTPTTNPSNAGLNPEHGKPGHRCDIAVGAPLDSKPTATVTTTPANTNTAPTVSSIPSFTPVQPTTETKTNTVPVKTEGTTAAGMNPEHGKPGHRCDIAVGAPLDSKPTTVTVEKKN